MKKIADEKTNLKIFWFKDESLEDLENLRDSDTLAYHADNIIDQIVYKLYGLTEEEINIVEDEKI